MPSRPPALFLHANGFAPGAYGPLRQALEQRLHLVAPPLRPVGRSDAPPPALQWSDLADDAVRALDEHGIDRAIAIGHSMGGTILTYAAAAHPDRFTALAFIEPAMVTPWQAAVVRGRPAVVRHQLQPAKATFAKRDTWPDEAAFRASCAKSGLYEGLRADAMDAFVRAAIEPGGDGVRLTFPKAWEAHFYATPPFPGEALGRVQAPVVGLRGASSVFLDDARWTQLVARQPTGWYRQLGEHGHLLPLEAPEATADALLEGLQVQGVLPGL